MADPITASVSGQWDRSELQPGFSVEELARRVGNYRWVEEQLFEVLGGWVQTVPEPEVKLLMGTHSHHHAWHSELWNDRLPEIGGVSRRELTRAPNEELIQFLGAFAEPDEPDQTLEKMVGIYRVLLPQVIATYTYHLHNTVLVTDAPVIRALRLALQDDLEDWRDGEMVLQSLISRPEDVDRASAHQARLEKLMLRAGGIAGPACVETL